MGYHQAGFDVVGVDVVPQPRFPFEFVLGDALSFPLEGFDVIHASPPCQAYTLTNGNMTNACLSHPRLVEKMRVRLQGSGVPWVIENVVGAPLLNSTQLCGSSFGLGVGYVGPSAPRGWFQLRRHRLFESNMLLLAAGCTKHQRAIGLYGDHACWDRRRHGPGRGQFANREKVRLARAALGIDWSWSWRELVEAIPPAYTEFIGGQLVGVRSGGERVEALPLFV